MLLEQTGEPAALEVVSWEGRYAVADPGPAPTFPNPADHANGVAREKMDAWERTRRDADQRAVYVTVRVREVNRFGAREVRVKTYKVTRVD
jgi:hypothetical protein